MPRKPRMYIKKTRGQVLQSNSPQPGKCRIARLDPVSSCERAAIALIPMGVWCVPETKQPVE